MRGGLTLFRSSYLIFLENGNSTLPCVIRNKYRLDVNCDELRRLKVDALVDIIAGVLMCEPLQQVLLINYNPRMGLR